MVEKYIELVRNDVEKLFDNDVTGHDTSHLERTLHLALKIQKTEGGDEVVVGLAAFLHDVHRIMQSRDGIFYLPKDSLPTIAKILEKIDITKEQKDKILFCIENHENYNWNGNNVDMKEALILQDADNIDAIGAIGIARSFVYGSANKIKMYDETIPLYFDEKYTETKNDASTIHHFYHKLLNLADYMNTKTGKRIAKQRSNFMKKFAEEFIKEWKYEK